MRFPWKYILVSLTIGLLLGGAAGIFYCRNFTAPWLKKSPEMFLKRLDHQLHLTEPQKTQILSLLSAKHDKVTAYEDDIRKTTRMEIRGILTPDQQPGFDAMIARNDAKRRKREAS